MKEEPNILSLLSKDELISDLFISRDNLLNTKKMMFEDRSSVLLERVYDKEEEKYKRIIAEVYRRMK